RKQTVTSSRARMAKTGESYTSARTRMRTGTETVLHLTNGDSAAQILREGGITDVVLPWRDVLHAGPVPAVPAARLRRGRAKYLASTADMASTAGMDESRILAFLTERDRVLRRHPGGFVLWFEADLYDQLQLIQI